jgi:ABC-type polysaccharide/polyol phosphate export permease
MPLIIFNRFFDFSQNFGPWTASNYIIFVLSTYNLSLLQKIIGEFPNRLGQEKFWKTLPALIIAPFSRFDLLLGIFLSHMVVISIPFAIFFIFSLILYPISLLTILFVLFIYILIALIFSAIGLFLGVFMISNENIWRVLRILLNLIFWASCISYPYDLFPEPAQAIIYLNPLYHIFTFLRMAWIQNNVFLTIITYWYNFIILILVAVILPVVVIFIFNKVYKKYGIVGY